ncbi:MAG: hypothetical protein IJ446_01940 [Oscillospiraceae bacterium]|nr:hypothetical protein [Oscillospiraceae bacterium]
MHAAIISDDDTFANRISEILKLYSLGEIKKVYNSAEKAIKFCRDDKIRCFFTDITADTGFDYIDRLHNTVSGSAVIFYAESSEQCFNAMDNGADYCITAPITVNKVIHGVEIASLLLKCTHKHVKISTFGNFEVYVNGNILKFGNAKAKELLALCVDMKGEAVSMEKAVSYLWENRTYDDNTKKLYRKAVIYLRDIFEANDLHGFFETGRGFCRINPEAAYCDYYAYLEQDERVIFTGEYMAQYSWAEETAAMLYFMQSEKKRAVPLDIIW